MIVSTFPLNQALKLMIATAQRGVRGSDAVRLYSTGAHLVVEAAGPRMLARAVLTPPTRSVPGLDVTLTRRESTRLATAVRREASGLATVHLKATEDGGLALVGRHNRVLWTGQGHPAPQECWTGHPTQARHLLDLVPHPPAAHTPTPKVTLSAEVLAALGALHALDHHALIHIDLGGPDDALQVRADLDGLSYTALVGVEHPAVRTAQQSA